MDQRITLDRAKCCLRGRFVALTNLNFGLSSSDSEGFTLQILAFSDEGKGAESFPSQKRTKDASKCPEAEGVKSEVQVIRIIRGLGGDKTARSLWGKLTGYSRRALVETAFSRMKRLFGDRLFSKRFEAQSVENHLRCRLLNHFARGGTNTFGDFVAS